VKIKTQSLIMVTGILLMPILVISLFIVVDRATFKSREARKFEEMRLESSAPNPESAIERILDERPKDIDMAIYGPDGKVALSSIAWIPVGSVFAESLLSFSRGDMKEKMLIFGFAPPLPAGYSAVVLTSRSMFLSTKAFDDAVRVGIVALASMLAFAAVMSVIMIRSITRSVLSLEAATRRVAAGELDLPIAVEGSNEIASLSRSLNSLREEIKEDQARRARFIMGISHDLKTPLALVKGYAEALEEELGDASPNASMHLGIIQAKSDQLEGMIDDLIDFERVDTGEWSRGLARSDLGPFLRLFVKRVESDAALLGRGLRGSIDLAEPAVVRMDERLITRVLENLVNNALRYTPEGGKVALSASADGRRAVVIVSDDGPGISAEDLPRVFEPFYKGSASRREQGMGLGLSIVKTIVESHGWGIEARSEEGKGAVFALSIPLEDSAVSPSP
jgi:signal transduction histidine kinase